MLATLTSNVNNVSATYLIKIHTARKHSPEFDKKAHKTRREGQLDKKAHQHARQNEKLDSH